MRYAGFFRGPEPVGPTAGDFLDLRDSVAPTLMAGAQHMPARKKTYPAPEIRVFNSRSC